MKRIATLAVVFFFGWAVMVLAQDPPAEPAGPEPGEEPVKVEPVKEEPVREEPVKEESVTEKSELSITDVTEKLVGETIAHMKQADPDMSREKLERLRFDTAIRLCECYWNSVLAARRSEMLLKQIAETEVKYRKALSLPKGDTMRDVDLGEARILLEEKKMAYLDSQKSYIEGVNEFLKTMVVINPLAPIDRKIVLSSAPYVLPKVQSILDEKRKFFTPELLKKDKVGIFDKRDLTRISLKLKVSDTYLEEYLKATSSIRTLRKLLRELEKKQKDVAKTRQALAEADITKLECAADIDRILRYLNLAEEVIKATEKEGEDE